MGQCIGKGSDDPFNDIHPHIFSVLNIDENGSRKVEGRIEVTETDLILNQRGHDRIRWPLRSLRRYGFEAGVFSFESGRRCPTGPGIYAFRCSRAQNLFNLLQSRVRNPFIDDRSFPAEQSPPPDPGPREQMRIDPNRVLLINPLPTLAPGSYINITPNQQDNDQEDDIHPNLGTEENTDPHETITRNDILPSITEASIADRFNQDRALNDTPLIGNVDLQPESPTYNIHLHTSQNTANRIVDPENNNTILDSNVRLLMGHSSDEDLAGDHEHKNGDPNNTSNMTHSRISKPPALDISSDIHLFSQRTPIDPPTYENIDLSNCPPPLLPKSKPTTPISPKHVEIEHKFFPDSGIPPLFEESIRKTESPAEIKDHQLSYAVLDLNPPSSNVNPTHHSPASPAEISGMNSNRSPHFSYSSDLAPAKHLSKSADSLTQGSSNLLLQNPAQMQQEEQIGSEYTHIDIQRTKAYLESKEQNENNGLLVYDGAVSNVASHSIPEDRAISINEIKEGNNNPLIKALTKALPTITTTNFDFNAKRNSVISN